MKAFANLFDEIDVTTSTNLKVEAMTRYFKKVAPDDAAWALFFLTGRKLLRLMPTAVLRESLLIATGMQPWLLEESYANVGDLAETIALLLPSGEGKSEPVSLTTWVSERLFSLRDQSADFQQSKLLAWWSELETREIFILNKLVTGSFRAGVSQSLVVRALARLSGVTEAIIAHRLMGTWQPSADFFNSVIQTGASAYDPGLPYPFYLASPLEGQVADLGDPSHWILEWKWDGIRAQAIHRNGSVYLWSRGEELITDRFPEISEAVGHLPAGTVLDGEILAFRNQAILPFADLQQRIGRKKITAKILEQVPVVYMVFDLLEQGGQDLRSEPLSFRRAQLAKIIKPEIQSVFQISPQVTAADWQGITAIREESRTRKVEGLMLKHIDSVYKVGRKRGDWWKWKVTPYTMDAVLLYAQPGHGRRATLYTDYTFGIWRDQELVPIAKAYSGLTDAEILEMDRWIRSHTVEKFGPVRRVEPHYVFELAFEGIAQSPRHKSGLAVRFPRILRRREDKSPEDADTVDRVRALLRVA